MEKICGIYQIKVIGEDLRYIGQSVNIERRRKEHIGSLNSDKHPNVWMQNYWNKYGESAFEHSIIEEIPKKELNAREKYWIAYYGAKHTFNATSGGEGAGSGKENPKYDPTIYTFYHKDGRVETCAQWELKEKYGVEHSCLSKVCSGKKKSVSGWGLKRITNADSARINQTIFTFVHKDGKEETCTQLELREKYGMAHSNLSRVCSGKRNRVGGWSLKKKKKASSR